MSKKGIKLNIGSEAESIYRIAKALKISPDTLHEANEMLKEDGNGFQNSNTTYVELDWETLARIEESLSSQSLVDLIKSQTKINKEILKTLKTLKEYIEHEV